jgi:hypothetical protein
MTDKYFIEHGYKQYSPTKFDSDLIVTIFQKRFDDDFGKKYFIDVLKWSHYYIPESHRDGRWKPFSYSYEIYTTMFEGEKGLDLKFSSEWTLEEVEKFMEDFFDKMKSNYYESWDGNRRVQQNL